MWQKNYGSLEMPSDLLGGYNVYVPFLCGDYRIFLSFLCIYRNALRSGSN